MNLHKYQYLEIDEYFMNYYVYDLIDPRTNQVFYVGKGQAQRMYTHVANVMKGRMDSNTNKCKRIKEILDSGLQVEHKIICSNLTHREALIQERQRIKLFGRIYNNTGILLNIKSGDEKPTKKERKIKQCDYCTGKTIKIFESTKSAARELNIRWSSSLSNAVRKKVPSYLGYLWCYENESPTIPWTILYQWDLNGILLNTFKNQGDAERYIGCTGSHLLYAINHSGTVKGTQITRSPISPGKHVKSLPFPVWKKFPTNKKVVHVNTNIVYNSVTEASETTGHTIQHICACCKGTRKKIGEDYFKYYGDN